MNRVHTPWGTTKNGHSGGVHTSPEIFKPSRQLSRYSTGAERGSSLQASLLAAQPSATALGLFRPVVRATVAAAAVVTPTAIEIATTWIATAIVAVGRRAAEITALTRGPWPVFRDIEPQITTADFTTVELLDGLLRVLICCESDECEPPRAARFTVLWDVNVNNLSDFSEELTQLLVGRGKVEVPYEYLA